MGLVKINWEYWQNFALVLVFVTLPMPKYSLNSQAIIFMLLIWLFSGGFPEKLKRITLNKYQFLSISIWCFLFIIGLLYSDNIDIGLKNLQKSLPLLVIPLVIFSQKTNEDKLEFLLKWFSISVLCCAVFALIKAAYFTYMGFGNYFYNQNLAALLNIHTTYYALFCVVVILYFSHHLLYNKSKNVYWLGVTFLLVFLYLLSSRISIFALGIGFFILLYYKYHKKSFLALIPIILIGMLFLFSPNFQKRETSESEFGTTAPSLGSRLMHWQAIIDGVKTKNVFTGDGSGTNREHIYMSYKNYGFQEGVLHKYNAHNQYLEYIIYFGLLALAIWVFAFRIWIIRLNNMQRPFLLSTVIVIFSFMITESILERQHGIVVFALFLSLTLSVKKQNE